MRGSSLATRGPRRALALVALALVSAALPAASSSAAASATLELPEGPHLAGEALVVRALVRDAFGAPVAGARVELAPYGASAFTNDDGVALLPILDDEPRVVALEALVDGQSAGGASVTWRAAALVLDPPSAGYVGRAQSFAVAATWLPDGAPVAGADLGLLRDGDLVESVRTDADGVAILHLAAAAAGEARYTLAFDDPRLRAASSTFAVAWADPPVNLPPVVGNVSVAFAGRTAQALVGNVSDPEGAPVQLHYLWEVDGADRGFDLGVIEVARGAHVRVGVIADDGGRVVANETPVWSATAQAPLNAPPTLDVLRTGSTAIGANLTFDARASGDAEGRIVSAIWRFSDGARAEGLLARHAFAQPGAHWAELAATDDEGATSRKRLEFLITDPDAQPPPPPPAPRFLLTREARTFVLDEYAASEVTLERELDFDGALRALLATPDGRRLWEPVSDRLVAVGEAPLIRSTQERAPGELRTTLSLGGDGTRLARVADPQPGLALLGVESGSALASWTEGAELLVLTDGADVLLRHEVPRLAVRLDVEPRADGEYLLRATTTGGAPLEQLRISANGIVIAGGRDGALELTFRPVGDTALVATASDVAGDAARAEARITPATGLPTTPPDGGVPDAPDGGGDLGDAGTQRPTAATPTSPVPTPAGAATPTPTPPPAPTPDADTDGVANGTAVTAAARDEAPGPAAASLVAALLVAAVAFRRRRA